MTDRHRQKDSDRMLQGSNMINDASDVTRIETFQLKPKKLYFTKQAKISVTWLDKIVFLFLQDLVRPGTTQDLRTHYDYYYYNHGKDGESYKGGLGLSYK